MAGTKRCNTRCMKKFGFAAVVAVASLVMAPPASAASSVSVDFQDAVLWNDCDAGSGVPVKLAIVGPMTAVRYEARVILHDPDGFRDEFPEENPGTEVSGSVAPGGATSNKTVLGDACMFDSPGLWRADVTVKFFDTADTLVETATGSDTATLRQAKSALTLTRGGPGRTLLIHATAETPTGFVACKHCFVRLQKRVSGHWKRVLEGETNRRGDFATGVTPKRGVTYRAKLPPFPYERAISATFPRP